MGGKMPYKIFHFTAGGEHLKKLDNLKRFSNIPIRVMLFIYDYRYNLLDILERLKPYEYKNSSYTIELEDENIILLNLNVVRNSEEMLNKKNGKIFLLISKKAPLCILVTNTDGRHFSDVLNFLNKYYPLLSRIFLRSHEMKELLSRIQKEDKVEISVKSYVVKRYYVKRETRIAYRKMNFEEVFKKAEEEFLWVDNLLLEITKNMFTGSVRINRRGLISYTGNLDYSIIYSLFISKILDKYHKIYYDILNKRSRTLQDLEPKPVRFYVDEEIFKSSEDINQFLESLHKNLHNWGYSVLFKEGSYLFVMLHDYQTGSSYEILISSPSEIFVIPQTQVTSISFSTLINFLVNTYDGVVEDVK